MLRKDADDLRDNGQVGDWYFTENDNFIVIRFPCPTDKDPNHSVVGEIPLRDIPDPLHDDWQWDGNREAPTLTPSINWVGVWHGYLRAGELVLA